MSTWLKGHILAIFTADWHLSLNSPIWRSNEPDWLKAQTRPLLEIREIQEQYSDSNKELKRIPVIVAGDIFDRWNSPAELINYAMQYIPHNTYTISGQHDQPYHLLKDLRRSAYRTLELAENPIKDLEFYKTNIYIGNALSLELCGFSFGSNLTWLQGEKEPATRYIAVVHKYIWKKDCSYNDKLASVEDKLRPLAEYGGYDVVVYGDNHIGFVDKVQDTIIFNCGSLLRRNADQLNYKPQIGLYLTTGDVLPYFLDISLDKHLDVTDNSIKAHGIDMKTFFEELEKLEDTSLDFETTVERYMKDHKVSDNVQHIILKAMEKK